MKNILIRNPILISSIFSIAFITGGVTGVYKYSLTVQEKLQTDAARIVQQDAEISSLTAQIRSLEAGE